MSGPGGDRDSGAPRLGAMFGRYRIESVIGRGGMGVVLRATDTALDRTVALKFLAPELADDPAVRERFMREPRLAASIEHPNIVPIHEAGVIDGVPFIAMRFIRGEDLAVTLRREAPLTAERTLAILRQLADALDAAHRGGLVHRDVKPGNVILEPDGAGGAERAWLTDFGLTRRMGDATVGAGDGRLGTIDYVAPEMIGGGAIGPRTDQYSLACLAVHALTGSPPWVGPTDAAVLNGHLQGDRAPVAARIPEPLAHAALVRALAVEPGDRFPDCRTFVHALAGEPAATVPATALPAATRGGNAGGEDDARDGVGAQPVPAGGPGGVRPTGRRPRHRATRVAALTGLVLVAVLVVDAAGGLGLLSGVPRATPDPTADPAVSLAGSPLPRVTAPPDDGVIVFSGGTGTDLDLWAVRTDGSDPWRITSDPGIERYPSVAPDGRWIVYSLGPVGRRDLWVVRADGTDARRLTKDPGDDYAPAVDPTGRRIAWTARRGPSYDILLMTDTGDGFVEADAVNLTGISGVDGNHEDILPAWTPDGRWIVFSSNRAESSDIWRVDPDRPLTVRPVTLDDRLWADTGPTVDGDGDVWFVGTRGHLDRELYEATRDGVVARRTTLGDEVIAPDVAPDGVRLVAAVGQVENGLDAMRTRLVIFSPTGTGALRKQGSIEVGMPLATDPDWVPFLAGDVGAAASGSPGPLPTGS